MDIRVAPSTTTPPTQDELRKLDAYWRAANYLSVGQIYLLDNPLLREPLTIEHVKPRLLGHWGTSPGLSFIYAHLNRVIKRDDLNIIYICGPGPRHRARSTKAVNSATRCRTPTARRGSECRRGTRTA
jgi:xylulose-5-phosphate/fructose-6-phosphate phosphoketolase